MYLSAITSRIGGLTAAAVLTIGGDLGEWGGLLGEIQYDLQLTSGQMKAIVQHATLIQKQFALTGEETQDLLRTTQEIEKVMFKMGTHSAATAAGITKALAAAKTFRAGETMEQTMEAGAKGIKIQLAGRLGGSEMARREKQISGSIPLSTLRAKIDYGFAEAKTAQGHIGVQVWVNQGMYEDDSDGADAQTGQAPKKPAKAYKKIGRASCRERA